MLNNENSLQFYLNSHYIYQGGLSYQDCVINKSPFHWLIFSK